MKRVLALLLDAASPDLIEKWTDDGNLPNLKRLREGGAYGRLGSAAEWLAEATHYAFLMGRNPGAIGLAGYSIWDKESMRARLPAADWLPFTPFWRAFGERGPRAVILDPADVYAPEPFNGAEIIGWATHHALAPYQSYPPELARRIQQHFGSSLLPDENYGLMTKREFESTSTVLHRINRKFSALCLELMRDEGWDLFLAYNYTLHHGGHRLWSTINITDRLSPAETAGLEMSLLKAYVDCDEAVGRVVDAAGPDARIMIFSLHGMGVNHSRIFIFPDMLQRIIQGAPSSPRLLERIRELVPQRWRHEVKSRLPFKIRRGLTSYWTLSKYDWATTRAFSPVSDTEGWVRINLKGREARGIVEPGAEYEALCAEITEGLKSFADSDTGEPVVRDVVRPGSVFHGARVQDLPDLIVRWSDSPAAAHRAVSAPRYGTIPWPTPGRNPEGRSGNHRPEGLLIAAGQDVRRGPIVGARTLDLAPTILALLGQAVPDQMEGRPLHLFG